MSTAKILLVEDDLFIRDIYSRVLQSEGFTVLTADDGVAGLQLGKDNPDAAVMLLDIMLPQMHGIEVLSQLHANPATKALPVIMLTNMTEESIIQEAMNLGAKDYLLKVRYTPPQIVEKVKAFLASQSEQALS
jgi:DNA-binding response OmpR family regulator